VVYGWAMPKTIQIRNVPDDVHRALRTSAAAAGMSLSDYLLAEIQQVASRPPISEVLRRAGARPGGVPIDDIVAAVRSGRDR
jgi:plasmid stability protein